MAATKEQLKRLQGASKDQMIANCILALVLWSEVDPKRVNLETWKCGTKACFGGWLQTWPEFRETFGITGDDDGAPVCYIRDPESNDDVNYWGRDFGERLEGGEIAQNLFGDENLFNSTDDGPEHDGVAPRELPYMSHYDIVKWRLENQIALLSGEKWDKYNGRRSYY